MMVCKKEVSSGLDQEQKKILQIFNSLDKPVVPKQIAETAGLETNIVSAQIKTLKEKGLIHSPVRCKYAITKPGQEELNN